MYGVPWWVAVITACAALVGSAGIGGILKTWFDHKRGARAQTDSVALSLVETLSLRVTQLEEKAESDQASCEERLRDQKAESDRKLAMQDNQLMIMRHRIRNGRQIIYSMISIMELPTTKRLASLDRIRKELGSMEQAEATEVAIIAAATIPPFEDEDGESDLPPS